MRNTLNTRATLISQQTHTPTATSATSHRPSSSIVCIYTQQHSRSSCNTSAIFPADGPNHEIPGVFQDSFTILALQHARQRLGMMTETSMLAPQPAFFRAWLLFQTQIYQCRQTIILLSKTEGWCFPVWSRDKFFVLYTGRQSGR